MPYIRRCAICGRSIVTGEDVGYLIGRGLERLDAYAVKRLFWLCEEHGKGIEKAVELARQQFTEATG